MSVRLEAIKLNYEPGSSGSAALNIRRNASQVIPIPEWRFEHNTNPADSPAAYSLRSTEGRIISIQAQFRALDTQLPQVEIRAINPILSAYPKALRNLLRRLLKYSSIDALGEVKARTVTFRPGGTTVFETFDLESVSIQNLGVGVWSTTWLWQYRLPQGHWKNFETSRHRIYVVVDIPNAPWSQSPFVDDNKQVLWTEVLDYACHWAARTKNIDDAATQITRSVYDLGGSVITYDCPCGGKTRYCSSRKFYCTRFIERLRGGCGYGFYVNCTDCATIVSTFANAVGANLFQSRMEVSQGGPFRLNPILLIGSADWRPCFKSFHFHDVAWKGSYGEADEIFDACLQLDGDRNPTEPPHSPLLPTNLKFGKVGTLLYRDRLVAPADRLKCEPDHLGQRREVV